MRVLGRKWTFKAPERYNYSVYFLKGTDPRPLHISQQQAISSFVKADDMSTSFLVYNPIQAVRKLKNWQKVLPWIQPHYAIKSNPYDDIVTDFVTNGAGTDCASRQELRQSLSLGVSLDSIVYSNSIKNEADLKWAGEQGVKLTTADSID